MFKYLLGFVIAFFLSFNLLFAKEAGQSEDASALTAEEREPMVFNDEDILPEPIPVVNEADRGLSEHEFNFLVGGDMRTDDGQWFEKIRQNAAAVRAKKKATSVFARKAPTDLATARAYLNMLDAAKHQETSGQCGEICLFGQPTVAGYGRVAKYFDRELSSLKRTVKKLENEARIAAAKAEKQRQKEAAIAAKKARAEAAAAKAAVAAEEKAQRRAALLAALEKEAAEAEARRETESVSVKNGKFLASFLAAANTSRQTCEANFSQATIEVVRGLRQGEVDIWPVAHHFSCLKKFSAIDSAGQWLATAMEQEETGNCRGSNCLLGRAKRAGKGPVYRYLNMEKDSLSIMKTTRGNSRVAWIPDPPLALKKKSSARTRL